MLENYNITKEIYRKLIHIIYSTSIAMSLWYFGKDAVLPWFISIAIILPLLDYGRQHIDFLGRIFFYFFAIAIRPIEHRTITGASWVVIGAAVTTIIFYEKVAIISLLVLSISDSLAAIIGVKFGKTKLFNKTLEGTTAFFLSSSFIILLLSSALFIVNISAAVAATAAELFATRRINDNLSIPIVTAFILSISG